MRLFALLLSTMAVLVTATGASAAECPKTSLAEIEAEVMCPICGTPLGLASEAPQANRERALIQRLVDRCRSKDQIKAVLVAEFGDDVLALPEAEGFNLTVYAVPAAVVLLAGLGIALAARRWRRTGGPATGPLAAADEPDRGPDSASSKRLDADLERYEL